MQNVIGETKKKRKKEREKEINRNYKEKITINAVKLESSFWDFKRWISYQLCHDNTEYFL